MAMLESEFVCAYCGSVNAVQIDPSAGARQQYTEDCQTCCRPNLLSIEIAGSRARIEAEREDG
jgi:hypothetical protein